MKARYAYVRNDSDPGSCGDLDFQFYAGFDFELRGYVSFANSNGCDGETWNFPNRTVVVDDFNQDFLVMVFAACDYDDTEGAECSSGEATLDLLAEPGNFTKTAAIPVNYPYNDPDGDLDIDVTCDYSVEYHA